MNNDSHVYRGIHKRLFCFKTFYFFVISFHSILFNLVLRVNLLKLTILLKMSFTQGHGDKIWACVQLLSGSIYIHIYIHVRYFQNGLRTMDTIVRIITIGTFFKLFEKPSVHGDIPR